MKVKALETVVFGYKRYTRGQVYEMSEKDYQRSWVSFQVLDEPKKVEPQKEEKKPRGRKAGFQAPKKAMITGKEKKLRTK